MWMEGVMDGGRKIERKSRECVSCRLLGQTEATETVVFQQKTNPNIIVLFHSLKHNYGVFSHLFSQQSVVLLFPLHPPLVSSLAFSHPTPLTAETVIDGVIQIDMSC